MIRQNDLPVNRMFNETGQKISNFRKTAAKIGTTGIIGVFLFYTLCWLRSFGVYLMPLSISVSLC
jgi:hypothetical protein